jgi:hypothetical protein
MNQGFTSDANHDAIWGRINNELIYPASRQVPRDRTNRTKGFLNKSVHSNKSVV